MEKVLEFFTGTLNTVAWIYILLSCVLIRGLYFTVRSRGVQFTKLGYALKNTVGKLFRKDETTGKSLSPFQAMTTALAATVGTGNIIGTCQAIAMGGYGALFWLWVAGLLGMVIKYAEVVLAVHYRKVNDKGELVGGPMYYIVHGMGKSWKWLAIAFASFALLASFGIGNLSQANSIAGSVNNAFTAFSADMAAHKDTISLIVGIVLAALTAFVLFGGIKRIGKVTEMIVPFMCLGYIVFTLTVIFFNIANVGEAFYLIFAAAFTPKAVLGAATGIALKEALTWGLRRSAFSNEAGLGSAAMSHATAETDSPVKQGMFGIFEVFVDTLVICTLTGLTVIISGVDIGFGVKPGSELITSAFATVFGGRFAAVFVAIALMFFAYSTILGWSYYGTKCFEYLFGTKFSRVYQAVFVAMIVVGATISIDVAWDLADTFNGLMAIPNFIALFALSGVVIRLTRDHFKKGELSLPEDKKSK